MKEGGGREGGRGEERREGEGKEGGGREGGGRGTDEDITHLIIACDISSSFLGGPLLIVAGSESNST